MPNKSAAADAAESWPSTNRPRRRAAAFGLRCLEMKARDLRHCLRILALLAPFAASPAFGAQFIHPTLGYKFTYASRWICDTTAVREYGGDGPVLTSFRRGEWIHGGIIPKGGAAIFVQASPRLGSTAEAQLVVFMLEYYVGDDNAAAYERELESMVASVYITSPLASRAKVN